MTTKKEAKQAAKKEAKNQAKAGAEGVQPPAEGDKEALLAAIGSLSQKAEEDNLTDAESKQVTKDYKALQKDLKKIVEGEGEATDKLEQLQAKFLAVSGDVKKWQSDAIVKSRKLEKANAAREVAQQDHIKIAGVKTKLETLCRELQKQNKAVMDDSKRVQTEEHAKRSELSAKFQDTIKDVSTKLDAQGEDRVKQFEENDALREKLKTFADQYELREQHFAHQLKTKDLEQQLNEAKLKHQTEISNQLEEKMKAYSMELETRTRTEIELRQQLSTYSEKFETFQDTLGKSNEVFGTFKSEMDKMSKTIKKLEKENRELTIKSKKCDLEILKMHEEKETATAECTKAKKQNDSLQSLCKTLQAEKKKAREDKKNDEAAVTALDEQPLD